MNSNTTIQLSDEFESAISEILPDLYQLLQLYQVSGTFELRLVAPDQSPTIAENHIPPVCVSHWDWQCRCYKCNFLPQDQEPSVASKLGIDSEKLQQFCTDLGSKLSASPRLNQLSSMRADQQSFEVHFPIDPATVNFEQTVVCRWVSNDTLQCSNS